MSLRNVGGYKIEEELGSGSAGTAYLGIHPQTGKQVAVKVLSRQMSSDELMQKRFVREMSVMSKLRHENVVELYECGLHEDQFYIIMEWVDFGTLKQILTSRGAIPWRESCECAVQICRALICAHAQGIVHRDLKPANVFLSQDGLIKLGDFGLAKDAASYALTTEGMTVGTCQYMSPEQIEGRTEVDGRLDIYSLGCLLYEMIAGKPPYRGTNMMEILMQHQTAAPPDVRQVAPDCPEALATLIQQMLAKSAAERPASAAVVAEQLEAILAGVAGPNDASKATLVKRLSSAPARKIPWKIVAVVGGVIALVVAAAIIARQFIQWPCSQFATCKRNALRSRQRRV